MGIEPYLVASSLETVVAQRLVRLICNNCKQALPEEDVKPLRDEFGPHLPDFLYHGKGCRICQGTGYRGRQGVFEILSVTDDVRSLILHRAPAHELRKVAVKQGMRSLREDGWRLLAEGRTTVDEVVSSTKDEEATGAFTNATKAQAPAPGVR